MNNDQMKAGRFLKLHQGRRRYNFIVNNLRAGNDVMLRTYTRAVTYKAKHVDMFKIDSKGSVWVQRGKNWDCIDFSAVTALGDESKLVAA